MAQLYFLQQSFQEFVPASQPGGKIKIAVGAGLPAKWDMYVNASQRRKDACILANSRQPTVVSCCTILFA
jgi:hypothetical protein